MREREKVKKCKKMLVIYFDIEGNIMSLCDSLHWM